jgi:hypothetical protein
MIQELSTRLSKQLEQDLEQVVLQIKDPFKKLTSALKLIRDALKKLRGYLTEYPFKSKADEIPIFKYTKPAFYQWQIYYTELYTIEAGLPFGDMEKQVAYLEQELHYIERFFRQYAFLYQYYKLGADELDTLYFVRGAEVQSVLLPNVPDLDPEFCTSCGYLFSKFKAFEGLQEWVTERLMFLKKNPLTPYQIGNDAGEMNWTGDTINLAEVGIGFFNTGQVRNGTASLSEIFRWLEDKFQVSIGVPSKRLAELRRRKRLSRTKYLDEMKESIIHKLDKEDEHDPGKGNNR